MNENTDDLPKVIAIAKCDQFIALVREAANLAGCQLQEIADFSDWNEAEWDHQDVIVVVDYTSPDVFACPSAIMWLRNLAGMFVVTDPDDSDAAFHAACMGATQVFTRPVNVGVLNEGFRVLLGTHPTFRIDAHSSRSVLVKKYHDLKQRQKDILRLLLSGEANKGVAAKLDIGLRTVESDRASMMRVFEVESFAELIRCATIAEEQMRLVRARTLARTSTANRNGN